jgi:CRP/FNR family transcriptional regulator, cyclic AMP receptor protein
MAQPQGKMPMNIQVSAQAQERLLSKLSSMGLPRPAAAALLERHMLVRYPKGAELFSMGSPADVVFAVLTGLVKLHSSRPGSDPVLVDLAGPGDLVGYADFAAAGGARSQLFEATALTNCCVALFTRHQVSEVLKGLEPEALLKIAEAINSMWSSVVYRYATFLGMSLRKRLEIVLEELAERFGVPDSRGTLLLPELAQEELAEMIGSSRPMVSKLLTEMTERGVLIRDGRRHILIAAQKQPHGAVAAREPGLHPAFEPVPAATRRVRADRRTVRPATAPIVTI